MNVIFRNLIFTFNFLGAAVDQFELQSGHYYADPETSTITVIVQRQGNCTSEGQVDIGCRNGTAKPRVEGDPVWDYEPTESTIIFHPGQKVKIFTIPVILTKNSHKYFFVELRESSSTSKIGPHKEAVCFIKPLETISHEEAEAVQDIGWAEQFRMAVTLLPSIDEHGVQIPLTNLDYALHGITFIWKLICALLPPRKYLGAYPTFVMSLILIGIQTALVEEFSNLLGCSAGLKTAVTGISLVALGTSLPDAFASRTAALFDDTADNSIGNITGSNSVNVFLGLGLPWLISTINAAIRGEQYCVSADNIPEAVLLFLCFGITCLGMLLLRRRIWGGELGGPACYKWLSGLSLIFLWIVYTTLLSLKSYGIIKWTINIPASSCKYVRAAA